jgi:hypothetical protein
MLGTQINNTLVELVFRSQVSDQNFLDALRLLCIVGLAPRESLG